VHETVVIKLESKFSSSRDQLTTQYPIKNIKTNIISAVPVLSLGPDESIQKELLLSKTLPVQQFLNTIATRKSFSIAGFKRVAHSMWKLNNDTSVFTIDYQSPSDMFDPKLFISGRTMVGSHLNVTVSYYTNHLSHIEIPPDHINPHARPRRGQGGGCRGERCGFPLLGRAAKNFDAYD